ncbi:hypothetical protein N0V83_004414 [Neocucurbitaria cava]|uniref:Uncharacterized protein n=1 Tax=Neocucurbitaria cava TaxID=798079 RepID=A0A9W8YBH0_9PLEO|nr:hypothetical protein N0V83_004414 [Neocucurbitaria cava]
MVLSMIIAAIVAPGLLGSQEAIRQSQSKERREEHRARRCNLIATCVKSSLRSKEINGRPIVLRDGKLWIDTGTQDGLSCGHPYAGYFLPYPDSKHEGLVTTITDVAPIMNWIYVDQNTYEIKYGVRADAQHNLTGPFDCTRQDRRLTFDGWEGWCAVEERTGYWAVYFDVGDNGLQAKVATGTKVLEIELSRKEKKILKEPLARQQDQTTKRAVNANEDSPVELSLATEELAQKAGVFDFSRNDPKTSSEAPKPSKTPTSMFNDTPSSTVGSRSIDLQPTSFDNLSPAGVTFSEDIIPPKSPPPAYSIAMSAEESRSPPERTADVIQDGLSSISIHEDENSMDSSSLINTNVVPLSERSSDNVHNDGSKRMTRATSNASLVSIYSSDERTSMDEARRNSTVPS